MRQVSKATKQLQYSSLSFLLLAQLSLGQIVSAAENKTTIETSQTQASTQPTYDAKALRRFDFRVANKSCPTCLHHMQDRMKDLPGALKVAVMLQKPYGAVVIYDSSKLNVDKILDKAREGLPDVEFDDKTDVAIKAIPIVIVPAAAAKGTDAPPKSAKTEP